jgi:hypothetical protein
MKKSEKDITDSAAECVLASPNPTASYFLVDSG